MLISREHNFAFIHIPKTGGSTIRTLLSEHADQNIFPWHYKLCQCLSRLDGIDNIFAVVRNPYSRYVSYWKYCVSQIHKQQHHPRYHQLTDIHITNVLYGLKGSLDKVQHNQLLNAQWDNNDCQLSWITNIGGEIDPRVRFFRLEDELPGLEAYLESKFSIKVDLQGTRINEGTNTIPFQDYFTDEELILKIRSHFAEDFNVLGYEMTI